MTKFPSRLHKSMFGQARFTTTLQWGFYLAVFAVVTSLLALLITATRSTPAAPNLAESFNRISRVQFVAQNFVRLWLTGTEQSKAAFKSMLTDPTAAPTVWPTDPVGISDVNVADFAVNTAKDGETMQWYVVIGATLTTSGNDNATRNYYAVNLMDRPGTSVRAVSLPRIVNLVRPGVTVALDYPNTVPMNSTLASAVANFANAYYTDQTGSLPRYTTREFTEQPIISSPYTSTELLSIKSNQAYANSAKPGVELDLLVQVKMSISLTSFQVQSVPMKVRATDNGQWLVADLSDFLYYTGAATK